MKLTRIYTRGGDKGETSLGDGARACRSNRGGVEAFGTVDEANAALGLARLHTAGDEDAMLARIQNDLFDLGARSLRPRERPARRGGAAAHRRCAGEAARRPRSIA